MTVDLGPLLPLLSELQAGRPLLVLTGPGISAESGLPAFRQPEDLAAPDVFRTEPEKVWRWLEAQRALVFGARPNDGHLALARLGRLLPRLTLLTQTVDSLHGAAGSPDVVELYGSMLRTRCTVEGTIRPARSPLPALPPHCPVCGALLRPDVVWPGEPLPRDEWQRAERAAAEASVLLVVGASSVASPVERLAIVAARSGARLFEVGAEAMPLAPLVDAVFRASVSEVLTAIARAVAVGAA